MKIENKNPRDVKQVKKTCATPEGIFGDKGGDVRLVPDIGQTTGRGKKHKLK